MAAYLVVAHQTAASPELILKLRQIAMSDAEAEFVLLVPATPPAHLLSWVEGAREEIARRRATEAMVALRRAGLQVIDALVGDAEPLQAVRHEHDRGKHSYALTVISTLAPGFSRWLRRDLANQVRSQLGLPVMEVVSRTESEKTVAPDKAPLHHPAPAPATSARAPAMDLASLAAWRGSHLRCLDGDVGQVQEIVYDYVSSEPLWLGVASKPLPFRTLLVPAPLVQAQDGVLVASVTREKLLGQPDVSIGEGIASLTDEEDLFRYFGMPFEMRDERVLRLGQHVPGGEQNQQAIFESEAQAVSK